MKKFILIFTIIIFSGGLSFAEFPAVEVYQNTSKAVVLIISQMEGRSGMIGAGSIISPAGLIVTNAHVVVDKGTASPFSKVNVFLKPDQVTGRFDKDLVDRHKARVLAFDLDLDLAVLKIEDIPSTMHTIELANPEEIKIGEEAIAIGHPEQGGLWTLTYGRISGEIYNLSNIEGKDVYQTDASVNRGNSGGPLLDRRGYLVGVNSSIARLGSGNLPITGVNFAIKSSVVKKWLNKNGYMIVYGERPLSEKTGADAVMPSEDTQDKIKGADAGPRPESKVSQPEEQKTEPSVEDKDEPVRAGTDEGPEAEKQKAEVIEKEKKVEDKKKDMRAEPEEPSETAEKKFQTPRKPYNYEELLKTVETELEDLMDEMRSKIRRERK